MIVFAVTKLNKYPLGAAHAEYPVIAALAVVLVKPLQAKHPA